MGSASKTILSTLDPIKSFALNVLGRESLKGDKHEVLNPLTAAKLVIPDNLEAVKNELESAKVVRAVKPVKE